MMVVRPTSQASATITPARVVAFILTLAVLAPMLSGCLQRSTAVGDRFSGTVILATTPDNPQGQPQLDIPESMAGAITVSEYRHEAGGDEEGGDEETGDGENTDEGAEDAGPPRPPELIGSRVTYSELTPGQFGQLGDIIANAFGESSITMDLSATRGGDIVRMRGSADLGELAPGRDFIDLSVGFSGPIIATDGRETSQSSATWELVAGEASHFRADAEYADPATAAVWSWSWFMALACLLVVGLVVFMAYSTRNRDPRPGRPSRERSRS